MFLVEYNFQGITGRSSVWLECCVRDAEVARSNRVAPIFWKWLMLKDLQQGMPDPFVLVGKILGNFSGLPSLETP